MNNHFSSHRCALIFISVCSFLLYNCSTDIKPKSNNTLKGLEDKIELKHGSIKIQYATDSTDNHIIKVKTNKLRSDSLDLKKEASLLIQLISDEIKKEPFYKKNITYNLEIKSHEEQLNLNVQETTLLKINSLKLLCDTLFHKMKTKSWIDWEKKTDSSVITIGNNEINLLITEGQKIKGELEIFGYSNFEFFENNDSIVLINYNTEYSLDSTNSMTTSAILFNLNNSKIVGLEI